MRVVEIGLGIEETCLPPWQRPDALLDGEGQLVRQGSLIVETVRREKQHEVDVGEAWDAAALHRRAVEDDALDVCFTEDIQAAAHEARQ